VTGNLPARLLWTTHLDPDRGPSQGATVRILDCTLRDGSYAINFQFTASDTFNIARALDSAGIELIEVGHGVGLGASRKGFGEAAETDEHYLEAAAEAVQRGKYGMFCIPGIATLEDVDMAAGYGMKFIRIGTNVTDVADSAPYIERALKHGMFVCSNLMKSYVFEPGQFGQVARQVEELGSQTLYIVDSAGGMLPGELEQYIRAAREHCGLPLAFHGHDNLGLAVWNSLRAVELGVEIVDSTLQALGRSSGNAATEVLVAALTRMGYDPGVDPLTVMDIGEELVRPLVRRMGFSSLDIVCGLAQFHSSYMSVIRQVASKYRVDPRKLILEVCKEDRADAPLALVERCASRIQEKTRVLTSVYQFERYFGDEQQRRAG
jgi:4-hydroxy-2-oxovalerate aldolase